MRILLFLIAALTLTVSAGCIMNTQADKEPGPNNIELYARELEARLHRRYNNTPKYAGKVALVHLVLAKEPRVSVDGKETQVEWSQIVYDKWGERMPPLEEEYYVVTFGDGMPRRQITKPSLTVGMQSEGGYSEFESANQGRLKELPYQAQPDMLTPSESETQGAPESGPLMTPPPGQENESPSPEGCAPCDACLPNRMPAPALRAPTKVSTIPVIPAASEAMIPLVVKPTPSRSVTSDTVGQGLPLGSRGSIDQTPSVRPEPVNPHLQSGGPMGGFNTIE